MNPYAYAQPLSSHKVAEYKISALPQGVKTNPTEESGRAIVPSDHIELAEVHADSEEASLPNQSAAQSAAAESDHPAQQQAPEHPNHAEQNQARGR